MEKDTKILIVDSNDSDQEKIKSLLSKEGFSDVSFTKAFKEGFEKALNDHPDIVVVDTRLPDGNGFDFCRQLKDSDAEYNPKVIIISGEVDAVNSLKAKASGADDYVLKTKQLFSLMNVLDDTGLEISEGGGSIEDLQSANHQLHELVDDLKEQIQKLQDLDKRKTDFVATISHEFKNPLAIIQTSMDMILEGHLGSLDPKIQQFVSIGKKNAQRLLNLVYDLLDLSKIESGKDALKIETLDLQELAQDIEDNFNLQIGQKNLTFRSSNTSGVQSIDADHDKLFRILENLINNAIKYTPDGKHIELNIEKGDNGAIHFIVKDEGKGIPKDEQDKIFDKYERVAAEKAEGTGLGLAIVKKLVSMHNGTIRVESEPGNGCKFIVTLPSSFSEK